MPSTRVWCAGGVYFRNAALNGYDLLATYSDPLVPWQGYWIYVNNNNTIVKYLDPTQINTIVNGPRPNINGTGTDPYAGVTRKQSVNRGALEDGSALRGHTTLDNWKLQMIARRQDGHEDGMMIVGQMSSVKDGSTRLTLPKPPAPFADYVYTGIVHKGENLRYAQDIQPAGGTKSWDFEVSADAEGPVNLYWPNTFTLPRRLRLKIKDISNGRVTNLRSASSLTFNMQKGQTHRFQITADTAPSQPLAITGLRQLQTGRSNGYAYGVTVNQDATMNARILTVSGKTVRTLLTGRAATAGENRLNWDGRSEQGYSLPTGQYHLEVTVRGDDGQPVTQKLPITMVK